MDTGETTQSERLTAGLCESCLCIQIWLSCDSEEKHFFTSCMNPPSPPCAAARGNLLHLLFREPPLAPRAETPHEYESRPSRWYLILCYLSSWVGWTIHTMHFLKELQINHDKGNNAGMLEWHVIVLLLRHNEARRENSSHAALSWKTLILGRLLILLPLNENLIFFFPPPQY